MKIINEIINRFVAEGKTFIYLFVVIFVCKLSIYLLEQPFLIDQTTSMLPIINLVFILSNIGLYGLAFKIIFNHKG